MGPARARFRSHAVMSCNDSRVSHHPSERLQTLGCITTPLSWYVKLLLNSCALRMHRLCMLYFSSGRLFLLPFRVDAFHDPAHPFSSHVLEAIGPEDLIGAWKQRCRKDHRLRMGESLKVLLKGPINDASIVIRQSPFKR